VLKTLSVLKTFKFLALGIVALAASLWCGGTESRASGGDAPWCIINDEGDQHCYYVTSQACLQEIAGGNRGFCVQNPAGSAAAASPEQQTLRRRK